MSGVAAPYRPLVAAATRTGLTLLVSIARELIPLAPGGAATPKRTLLLRKLCRHIGKYVHERMSAPFRAAGLEERLLYNAMFHPLAGGTKWLKDDRVGTACIRKYIGVKGMGDFTLIISHPREVLETDDVLHSHEDPRRWFRDGYYGPCTRFAAIRHPAGTINSAMFSINALTSEYIQRYAPAEDEELIRQDIARYKLTDLDFFRSVLKYYAGYLRAFLEVRERFIVMRWEDLIRSPAPTIGALAQAAGIPLAAGTAAAIWRRLDHVNLTGPHRHNYRKGRGIVGDWKNWLVNEHLQILREAGLEPVMRELGYGPLEALDPAAYTPFQKEIASLISQGKVYRDFRDPELFGFSVQKSNVDWRDLSGFRGYEWRAHTRLERSCFADRKLELRVWDEAERAVARGNALLRDFLDVHSEAGERSAAAATWLALRHGWSWFPVYLRNIAEHRRGAR